MISQQVLNSVRPVSDTLNDKGERLVVESGTLLSRLVDASISAKTVAEVSSIDTPISIDNLIEDSKLKSQDGVRVHDVTMEETVKLVSETVAANFNLARNVVVPATKEIFDLYNESMDKLEVDAKQPVSIVPNVYHAVWGMPQLSGLVERFENTPLNEAKVTVPLPMLNGAEILEMLKTGIEVLDNVIVDWFGDQPIEKITDTYRNFFVHGNASVGRQTNSLHKSNDGLMDRNDILLVFLVSIGFEEHMPDGINMDLADLRLMLTRIREQSGRAIAGELNRRQRDIKNNVMIYSVKEHEWRYTSEGRRIVMVNNDVYLKFLEEGGTPEAIFGSVIKNKSTNYASILADKDANEVVWTRYFGLHTQRVSAQIYSSQREALRLSMTRYINSLDEEDLIIPKSELHKRATKFISEVQPKFFEDELRVVRKMTCDVLYAHTNAKMVLDAMETAEIENPDMSARECALFSAIDLVARWIAAQINIKYS